MLSPGLMLSRRDSRGLAAVDSAAKAWHPRMAPKATFHVVEVLVLSTVRAGWELFLISFLVLFLELACIRWLPAHVLFLTFFTNTVLLACFLGMSVGCLAAGRDWNLLLWTPVLLALALAVGHGIEYAGVHQLPRS